MSEIRDSSSVSYAIDKFTDKDLFECKLSGKAPDFGYVSGTMRPKFIHLLTRHRLVKVVSCPGETGDSLALFDHQHLKKVKFYFSPLIKIYYSQMGPTDGTATFRGLYPGSVYAVSRGDRIYPAALKDD